LLDDYLRMRQGVYEYSAHANCLFRIQRAKAEGDVELADGVRVCQGDSILNLHLWNEHVPALDPCRLDLRWARLIAREIATSLKRLAIHMAGDRTYDDIVAVRAVMRFGTAAQNERILALSNRYGFESVRKANDEKSGAIRELGEKVLGVILLFAANPGSARFSALRHDSALIYMSRATLDRRHLSRRIDAQCQSLTP
jgi:hypothetical protein